MLIRRNKKTGFTLVELLIVAGMFSVVITVVASLFVSSLRTEKSILDTKRVLGEVSYAMEYISRALRMAEKDIDGTCIGSKENYDVGPESVAFINALQDDACQRFYLEDGKIKFDNGTKILDLTSDNITIENLKFNLHGESQTDDFQPFVTIYFEAHTKVSPVLAFQTSVSQRNPDIRR